MADILVGIDRLIRFAVESGSGSGTAAFDLAFEATRRNVVAYLYLRQGLAGIAAELSRIVTELEAHAGRLRPLDAVFDVNLAKIKTLAEVAEDFRDIPPTKWD